MGNCAPLRLTPRAVARILNVTTKQVRHWARTERLAFESTPFGYRLARQRTRISSADA
jgi:DNA-binding transcriptional MerR regulator